MTKGDGTATFNNVIGGDMQIVAFAPGAQNNYQAITLTVNQPTSVQIKIDRYVALGSLLIPVSSLIDYNRDIDSCSPVSYCGNL